MKTERWSFQRFHCEVKCHTIFKSIFCNMIATAIVKVSESSWWNVSSADDLKIANKKIKQRAFNVQFSTVPLSSNQLNVCESHFSPLQVMFSFINIPADIYRLYCITAKYLKSRSDFHSGIIGTHFARVISFNKREMIFRLFFRFRRPCGFPKLPFLRSASTDSCALVPSP